MPPKSANKTSKKKKAARLIQRYAKGWIARYFYRQFKHIVKLRETPARELLSTYRHHLQDIITRHGGGDYFMEDIDLREVYDYYIKLDKYEIAYEELAEDREDGIGYRELPLYFEVLSLTPTRAEIRMAVDKVLGEQADEYQEFIYNKETVVDVAMHIFVPRGTRLQNTRKSTWLCPLVGNDDVLRFGDDLNKVPMGRCMRAVTQSIRGTKDLPPLEEVESLESVKSKVKGNKKRKGTAKRKL